MRFKWINEGLQSWATEFGSGSVDQQTPGTRSLYSGSLQSRATDGWESTVYNLGPPISDLDQYSAGIGSLRSGIPQQGALRGLLQTI